MTLKAPLMVVLVAMLAQGCGQTYVNRPGFAGGRLV